MEMIDDPRDIPTIPAQTADDRFLVSHQQQNLIYTLQARVARLEALVGQMEGEKRDLLERLDGIHSVAAEELRNGRDGSYYTIEAEARAALNKYRREGLRDEW